MSDNLKNTVSAFASVLADMRTNQTKQETAIGKMIAAVYSMEATFDEVVIKRYFGEEPAKRISMQDHILKSEDETFAKELKFLKNEMEKDKRDRDVYEVENVKKRHSYLRGEFHKAMTALAFLRFGGTLDGFKVQSVTKLVPLKGRFVVHYIDPADGESTKFNVSHSSRALINAGTASLISQKLKTVKPAPTGDNKPTSLGQTVKASGASFATSVDLMLQRQTEELRKHDPKAKATVHDLADEAEQDVKNTAKTIARLLWEHDGKIDLLEVEETLKEMGFSLTYSPRRKTA